MNFSMFDLFKIGFGPSSSHTVGPMLACKKFVTESRDIGLLHKVTDITIELFGSLALTGKLHIIDDACVLGLMGEDPQTIEIEKIPALKQRVKEQQELCLDKERFIHFDWEKAFIYHTDKTLSEHPNGITITARGSHEEVLHRRTYFSIGGGTIIAKGEAENLTPPFIPPFPFSTALELLGLCEYEDITIADIVFANELAYAKHLNPDTTMENIKERIDVIWKTMSASIDRGTIQDGELPGPLNISRRAKRLHDSIEQRTTEGLPIETDDWVNLFAMAVSEENAAGGRIVSAPSNGAAGIIPAVIAYYNNFVSPNNLERIRIFLATAAGIGSLYKNNVSLVSENFGCQGEIGVACSMAAAGLAAAKEGSARQIEHAAEMAMEHNLGLTCDPFEGLVQIPCIERNTMGAVKAINAARLSLRSHEDKHISLDNMIQTMHDTGINMKKKYKTSLSTTNNENKIAVNVITC